MATRKNSTKKQEVKFERIDMGEGFFLHYRKNDYGLFNLEHNGAIIYGCRLVEAHSGNIFVSYPSRKGTDGKYYSHARFIEPIPDSVIEGIINATEF